MPQAKRSSISTLRFHQPALRWILILPALLALTGAGFAMRWYVGDTIAENTSTPDADGIEMARLATRWAPDDALAHWRLAFLQERNFSAENIAAAVHEYERAVQAEPYDYRYWMELGRALEAQGDADRGEKALRRAVELAPSYSHPRWQYGNLLLRQGKVDEAFAEFARAADADDQMQTPVFGVASQVFGNDPQKIARALPSPSLRLQFALNLIGTGKIDEALRVMDTISAADRKTQSTVVGQIVKALIDSKHFRAALELLRGVQPDPNQLPLPEQFWNGGFETPIVTADEKPFHWLINSRNQTRISIDDARPHSGRGSLSVVFKSPGKLESVPISQTVVVAPDTQYKLQFYLRTEGMIGASTPELILNDPAGQRLASSPPVPTGTNDWQAVTLTFKTKPNEDGILVSFAREPCGDKDPICPIFGSVWYDDFNLQRIGGPGPAKPGQR
jgi:Flp pilus assembly protein TadD